MLVIPLISPKIFEIAPGFRAISISVLATEIIDTGVATQALIDSYKSVHENNPTWAEAHLAAWGETFKKFGAKPKRTPCSAEALRNRVLKDGGITSADPIVDLYNAISIKYAIPVGGENYEAYVGLPHLTIAEGTEAFDTVKSGQPANEPPEKREVIWRDEAGVTCRRWNWRQGVRTRLDEHAKKMWFILESLPEMPREALQAASDELISGLKKMMPDAQIEFTYVEAKD